MTDSMINENPAELYPQPPFPAQPQSPPGIEAEMIPKPDFGEATYTGHGRLEGKAALITGGDSGIGRAVALAFAREGADVLISYLNEDVDADETMRVVRDAGRKGVAIAGDLSTPAHCRDLVDQTVSAFGKIDVLVNNAAHQMTFDHITEIPDEEWDYTVATNISAMFHLCKAAVPHMEPGSTIINTASIQAYQPSPDLLAYATTKGAIVTFSKALAEGLLQQGIRVNVVAPGPVWTPLIPMSMPKERVEQFGKQSAMGRPAQPAELAPIYVFLASSESTYIAGEVVGVTGGKPLV